MKITQIKAGQLKKFGDFITTYEVITDEKDKEKAAEQILEMIKREGLPESKVWSNNIRTGGEHFGDMNYHFRGYYKIQIEDFGYYFMVVEPYAD